jgi:hypothetical protein
MRGTTIGAVSGGREGTAAFPPLGSRLAPTLPPSSPPHPPTSFLEARVRTSQTPTGSIVRGGRCGGHALRVRAAPDF